MEIKDVEVRVSRQDDDYRLVFDYLEPSMQNLVIIPKEAYLALAEHFSSKKDVVRYSLIEKDNPSAERLSWDFKKKALENGLSESEVNKMISESITDLKRAMGDNPNESPCVKISDSDMATVEALHDSLLDEKVCTLDSDLLKKSRMLSNRMYGVLYGKS